MNIWTEFLFQTDNLTFVASEFKILFLQYFIKRGI